MSWVFSTKRVIGGSDAFIGEMKVAELRFHRDSSHRWGVTLTMWDDHRSFEPADGVNPMSEALKALYARLNSPAPE